MLGGGLRGRWGRMRCSWRPWGGERVSRVSWGWGREGVRGAGRCAFPQVRGAGVRDGT